MSGVGGLAGVMGVKMRWSGVWDSAMICDAAPFELSLNGHLDACLCSRSTAKAALARFVTSVPCVCCRCRARCAGLGLAGAADP